MIAQRLDGGAHARQGLGAERALDLLQVTLRRLLLAGSTTPRGIPQIVQVREPFRAGHRRPLTGVEPDSGAGGATVEMERMRPFDARAHEQAAAPRAESR